MNAHKKKPAGNRQRNRSSKNKAKRAPNRLNNDERSINENFENEEEIQNFKRAESNSSNGITITAVTGLTAFEVTEFPKAEPANAQFPAKTIPNAGDEDEESKTGDSSLTETTSLTFGSTSRIAETSTINRETVVEPVKVTVASSPTASEQALLTETATVQNNLSALDLLENNVSITLIQQLLRTKLLRQNIRKTEAHQTTNEIRIDDHFQPEEKTAFSTTTLNEKETAPPTIDKLSEEKSTAKKKETSRTIKSMTTTTNKATPKQKQKNKSSVTTIISDTLTPSATQSATSPLKLTQVEAIKEAFASAAPGTTKTKLSPKKTEEEVLPNTTSSSPSSSSSVAPLSSSSAGAPTLHNHLATLALLEKNTSFIFIQKLIRTKLLRQNIEENNTNTTETMSQPISANNKNVKTLKKSKSKEKINNKTEEEDGFLTKLQKKRMQTVLANGTIDLSNNLFENLQKLINQEPISDVESSDEDEEYIEYIYKPRQYFLVSLCNFCKCDLRSKELIQCSRCQMAYYCSAEHMKYDEAHKQLCYALLHVAENCGGHIFYKCAVFTTEQFRSYRIVTIRKVETIMNRPLSPAEQEIILFPRLCTNIKCREYRFKKLIDCSYCGLVAFCKNNPEHRGKLHNLWCRSYQLFKELIIFQEKFGRLDPSLPSKILKDLPAACSNTKQILNKLGMDIQDQCEYAALTQLSTCPLTAWYGLKLCDQLKPNVAILTIHLIGAEIEFEVDMLHKWELFFLHITPSVKQVNVVFIGPELNQRNISFAQLKKIKCCSPCRKNQRTVKYYFENKMYHDYCRIEESFLKPNLICFFNAGLYRSTGYHLEDTWPETILAAANLKCPVVVTSYTEYEAPLDMTRFVQESNRGLNVILPPIINPFASVKPERNFISDEDAPLIFKNFYCFVVE